MEKVCKLVTIKLFANIPMKTKETKTKEISYIPLILIIFLQLFIPLQNTGVYAQNSSTDLARYTPNWIKDGFVDAGASHEPWIFQVRRNSYSFNLWQIDAYDYQMTEEYIKALSESGVTVYHVSCYKGFGFKAEKDNMDKVAKAAAIAHKYGMKVDTYIQWNTIAYETFFSEVPEAKKDLWYQIDVNGKPIMLTYGYQQSFRYRPCFNHDGYMNYFKEKILRYTIKVVKTDFIHFDNFEYNHPREADHNPATIAAFRKYIGDKYTPSKRIERFGFNDISNFLPPMWNESNQAERIVEINDPLIQEWIDFHCWTLTTRLAECARFARSLNKEIVIEINPGGLVGSNMAWESGINHPDLMQYTNVIWTEDDNNPKWEDGVVTGKFRHYKLGRTTNNFIMTYNGTPQDFAENLALNRTIAYLGWSTPGSVAKDYLDFWRANKEFYNNAKGAEKVAVLRSYPSMVYNTKETQVAVNMAEQTLQQRQIPFDIIFDQQLGQLDKYYVLVLADQESLTDEVIATLKAFAKKGGGLVVTSNTGMYDGWRRLRKQNMLEEMSSEQGLALPEKNEVSSGSRNEPKNVSSFNYGAGRVIYLPELEKPEGDITIQSADLGNEQRWVMPENANEFESAVYWAAGKRLPLQVSAPEWVGVSHDTQANRDVIHLFNYNAERNVGGIILQYDGTIKKAWSFSPDAEGKSIIPIIEKGGITELRISNLKVYTVIVLEK
jgi:hypothetical protein